MGRAGRWILFSLAALSCMHAQQTDNAGVIAAFSAGGIFGVGAHGSVGGSLAVPLSKYLMPYVEVAYSPLSSYPYTYGADRTGKGLYRSHLVDFNGGLKVRFPVKGDWTPYVGAGAGLLHFASSDYASGYNVTSTVGSTRDEAAGNVSAGALYYFTPQFGFGIEAKGYAARNNRFGRVTAQVFYQFQ